MSLNSRWVLLLVALALFGFAVVATEHYSSTAERRAVLRNNTTYVALEPFVAQAAASHQHAWLSVRQGASASDQAARSAAEEFVKAARSAERANTVPALEFYFEPILSGAAIVEGSISEPVDIEKLREGLLAAAQPMQFLALIVADGRKAELANLDRASRAGSAALFIIAAAYAVFLLIVGAVVVARVGRPSPDAHDVETARPSVAAPVLLGGIAVVLLGFALVVSRGPVRQVVQAVAGDRGPPGIEAAYRAYDANDVATALRIAKPLAENGEARAQRLLGVIYQLGREVQRDVAEAQKWLRLAAEQGDAQAPALLGRMFFQGRGVPQNFSEAFKWYRLAADRNNPRAQYNLGILYWNGKGVPRDNILAHMWFNLAAAHFPPSEAESRTAAIRNRDLVENQMSRDEIAEAQKRAREWKPN